MNDLDRAIVQAVCENNLKEAKKVAMDMLNKDTAQKDRAFCNRMKNRLISEPQIIEPPANVKDLLVVEDVSKTFNEQRYYASEKEKSIADKAITMEKVSNKLAEMGLQYLNATMLYGESGTGKTTLGRYIAYKLGVPFIYLNFANVTSSYFGATQKNINKLLDWKDILGTY